MLKRKTKIVATLGPATNTPETIEAVLSAGADVIRLNLSHGTFDEHARALVMLREAAKKLNRPVAALVDLPGPKIRTGALIGGKAELIPGALIDIIDDEVTGDASRVSTTCKGLYRDVVKGQRLLLDDGLMELKVLGIDDKTIRCEVVAGGILRNNKGINLPDTALSAPALTERDLRGVDFAVEHGADYVALSFVRRPDEVVELKRLISEKGADIPVIAKIEKKEAIDSLDLIIKEAWGIMIARGDLGVELSPEAVPVLQKRIIQAANEAGKAVITATQMLESMITNPRPTRAEASDVANAVFDGTDCLMLSGETAIGRYASETIRIMSRIAGEAEEAILKQPRRTRRSDSPGGSFAQAVVCAAATAESEVNPKAIAVFTQSGDSARMLSKLRPSTPIVAFTPLEATRNRLSLLWGVEPLLIKFGEHTDEMICRAEAALLDNGIAAWGDTLIIVSGTKVGLRGATNMMKIDWIGSEECKLYLKKND